MTSIFAAIRLTGAYHPVGDDSRVRFIAQGEVPAVNVNLLERFRELSILCCGPPAYHSEWAVGRWREKGKAEVFVLREGLREDAEGHVALGGDCCSK